MPKSKSTSDLSKESQLSRADTQSIWMHILKYELKKKNISKEQYCALISKDWNKVREILPGCLNSSYKASQGSGSAKGVPVMSWKSSNYRPHRIACKIGPWSRRFPETAIRKEASHRCHNSLCCNPWHLVYEKSKVNRSRYCCEIFETTGYFCPHTPYCLNCTALNPDDQSP